jgi:bifunctional DNA-binding transcriptional regulator/antitoxin component of YhaV-PrlF toxin-antitoxin module
MSNDDKISARRGELTRLQAVVGERSLTVIFPKQFATELGIMKGDFLNCYVDAERRQLVVENVKK